MYTLEYLVLIGVECFSTLTKKKVAEFFQKCDLVICLPDCSIGVF